MLFLCQFPFYSNQRSLDSIPLLLLQRANGITRRLPEGTVLNLLNKPETMAHISIDDDHHRCCCYCGTQIYGTFPRADDDDDDNQMNPKPTVRPSVHNCSTRRDLESVQFLRFFVCLLLAKNLTHTHSVQETRPTGRLTD